MYTQHKVRSRMCKLLAFSNFHCIYSHCQALLWLAVMPLVPSIIITQPAIPHLQALLPTSPESSARWPSPMFARITHLIWSYPSSDNDQAVAVPQLGPLLKHWALAGIRDRWLWGGAQPDCPSDGLVPGSVDGEGVWGCRGASPNRIHNRPVEHGTGVNHRD